MDKFDIQIAHNGSHLIGYSVVRKSECEIFNFVSPTFRILRILEGVAEWKTGITFNTFHPGDVVILDNLHRRNIHKVLTDFIVYEFFDFLPSCLSNEILRNFFYTQIYKVVSNKDTNTDKIYFLLDDLRKEMEFYHDQFQIMGIKRHLDLLALEFYRSIEAKNPNMNSALDNITKSIQFIRNHLNENIKISLLADNCGYTPEYFSRIFKKYMGISPISYIINLRLENVIYLMSTTNMTILNAAYQSGFQSSSAFYKAFKAYKHISPSQYTQNPLL